MAYPGGKNGSGVFQKIINQIPPHRVYIEPFLGHGAILRKKKPATFNIGIDSDGDVVRHWHTAGTAENSDVRGLGGSLTIIKGDAISWLKENFYKLTPDTFVYLDPPYLMETRKRQRKLYGVEFATVEQHRELLDIVLDAPCMVAISGYASSLYAEMLTDWRTISYNTVNRAGQKVQEWLWMNYPEPAELHDYRYLGENFREREKITRQKRRWITRLQRIDKLQRYALLSSIAEYAETAVPPEMAISDRSVRHRQK